MPPPENRTPKGQEDFIRSWLYSWAYRLEKWRDHLWIGNQLKKFDEAILQLTTTTSTEVWLIDFAMTFSLVQAAKETQNQFFDKKFANDLGVLRYVREADGQIGRHYNDLLSTDKVRKKEGRRKEEKRRAREREREELTKHLLGSRFLLRQMLSGWFA